MHVLPDLLRPELRVVCCGTAAGAVSAAKGNHYAGPGNRFWGSPARTGLTPRQLVAAEYPLLLGFGIGLTDVAKSVSGSDAKVPVDAFDPARLLERMRDTWPGCLAFNGKKAASVALGRPTGSLGYGPLAAMTVRPPIVVLPSTSGAGSGFWDPEPWHAPARRLVSPG